MIKKLRKQLYAPKVGASSQVGVRGNKKKVIQTYEGVKV
jgi:hypothetical protein